MEKKILPPNLRKTKEGIVDFRRDKEEDPPPFTIMGEEVDPFKVLGIQITEDLKWENKEFLSCFRPFSFAPLRVF